MREGQNAGYHKARFTPVMDRGLPHQHSIDVALCEALVTFGCPLGGKEVASR